MIKLNRGKRFSPGKNVRLLPGWTQNGTDGGRTGPNEEDIRHGETDSDDHGDHGEKCEMADREIVDWYREHVAGLFDPAYGMPQISVTLRREEAE